MFGDPVLVYEQGRGIGGLGFGFGLRTLLLFRLDEGTGGLTGIVEWGGNQIEDEGATQSGAELAY